MNELLVILTDNRGRPVFDYVVSMRSSDADPWNQAIQDGEMGVYRRAIDLEPGARSVLQVQLKRPGSETVLRFPFKPRG
jgi:hypothetical protein